MRGWKLDITLRPVQFVLLALLVGAGIAASQCLWNRHIEIDPADPAADRLGELDSTLSIHTASASELAALPTLGRSLANAILRYRQARAAQGNPLTCAEDLLAVRGIGPKTLQRLRPYLRFEPLLP
ncbi:MAG: helix-hairpin-helix domain-containing protein [Phycisphaerales bacterium]|jgi:competence protein ComEA|nr:helix-hairpin-helix domain-containing protein [Phycisphaerales bacterium]MBT7171134.1 helix-hairpin-helix domain-containing protein [Phycisphaerales bacterium]